MRKIEQKMNEAVVNNKAWQGSNTTVSPIDDVNCAVFLHGNHIADVNSDTGFVMVNLNTLRNWPSMTTRSRLRALGADLVSIKGVLHLNGKSIYSE